MKGLSRGATRKEEMEREANIFAMCLLMPEKLVRDWLKRHDVKAWDCWDCTEDDVLKIFAKDFGVSMTIATLRLQQLGVFKI